MRSAHTLPTLALVAITLGACSDASVPPAMTQTVAPVDSNDASAPPPVPAPGDAGTRSSPAGWGPDACMAAAGTIGFDVGEALDDLGVTDCDTGAPATLNDVCGASGTWIFAAHTHCPTCQATAAFTDDVATAVAAKNVAVVMTVYDDNGTSCAKWRETYKLDQFPNVKVYGDPNGRVFNRLKISNFTAVSAFLNESRIITHKEHGLSKARVLERIDEALTK